MKHGHFFITWFDYTYRWEDWWKTDEDVSYRTKGRWMKLGGAFGF